MTHFHKPIHIPVLTLSSFSSDSASQVASNRVRQSEDFNQALFFRRRARLLGLWDRGPSLFVKYRWRRCSGHAEPNEQRQGQVIRPPAQVRDHTRCRDQEQHQGRRGPQARRAATMDVHHAQRDVRRPRPARDPGRRSPARLPFRVVRERGLRAFGEGIQGKNAQTMQMAHSHWQ